MDLREYKAKLADVEVRIKRLRALYDQYFQGIERIEPQGQRDAVDRLLAELGRVQQRNTALRFRYSQLVQRYRTYTTYWRRICRQIEEGTYKRDVMRAQRIGAGAGAGTPGAEAGEGPASYEIDLDLDVDAALAAVTDAEADAARASMRPPPAREITPFALPTVPPVAPPAAAYSASPPRPAPPRPAPPPPAAASGGIQDAQMQQLYARYIAARRQNHERVDNVKLESLARSVEKMMPKLQKKHAGKKIDFEVVVRDGRVALKPVAK